MADRILELTVFENSARTQSFSKTSIDLGMSQPSVSRIIGDLEQRLQVKLFHRSTKMMTLTEAGITFLGRARQILEDLEFAEQLATSADHIEGLIRLSLPPSYGSSIIIPLLPKFLARHPNVTFELLMSSDRPDDALDIADLAICLGDYSDSMSRVRRLASTPRLVVASPDYLRNREKVSAPGDLLSHDLVLGPGARVNQHWRFRREGVVSSIDSVRRVEASSLEGALACVRAGLGFGILPEAICKEELERGALEQVLQDYALTPLSVYAMSNSDKPSSAKLRALTDFFSVALGAA